MNTTQKMLNSRIYQLKPFPYFTEVILETKTCKKKKKDKNVNVQYTKTRSMVEVPIQVELPLGIVIDNPDQC